MLIASLDERLQAVMERNVLTIHPMEDREQIVDFFNERKLFTIPVTDLDGRLLGIIRNRAIIQASQ